MHKAKLPSGLNFEQGRKKKEFISARDGLVVASPGRKLLSKKKSVKATEYLSGEELTFNEQVWKLANIIGLCAYSKVEYCAFLHRISVKMFLQCEKVLF